MPAPGMDVRAMDEHCAPVPAGQIGALVVKLPLPPGTLPTLWNAEQRFREAYMTEFPGYYKTGDAGFIDGDGYVFVMTRTDDVINVAGHRLSTGAMEEVLASHPDVAECAVIGVADALKGQLPLGFLVLNAGCGRAPDEICTEVVGLVREKIGPVAAFKTAAVVQRLPKTRSGKILRGTMQKIADGDEWKMPATIDDPEILGEITGALRGVGYAGGGRGLGTRASRPDTSSPSRSAGLFHLFSVAGQGRALRDRVSERDAGLGSAVRIGTRGDQRRWSGAHASGFSRPCTTVTLVMKRRALEKMLRERGWKLLRHGGRHDIRTDGESEEAVPRHTEINERLARAILRRVKKASAT